MCCLNAIGTGSLEIGCAQVAFEKETSSGEGSGNEPFIRWPGSLTLNAASPAVEITFAVVDAV